MCVQDIRLGRGTQSSSQSVNAIVGTLVQIANPNSKRTRLIIGPRSTLAVAVPATYAVGGDVIDVIYYTRFMIGSIYNRNLYLLGSITPENPVSVLKIEDIGNNLLGDIWVSVQADDAAHVAGLALGVTDVFLVDSLEATAEGRS